MEKPMRKILNPNLISKKEQREVRKIVQEGLKNFSYKVAKHDAMRKAKHQH